MQSGRSFLRWDFSRVWALVSWTVSIAPILALLERSLRTFSSWEALRLGKAFTSKLAEINLVLGIVKLALLVLAMVFSAAPLPFGDELGPSAMHFGVGCIGCLLPCCERLLSGGAAQGVSGVLEVYRGLEGI